VDAQETEVTEADHLSFRLSLFLPDNPCEVEMEPVSTPGESPKPTAKLASPKVQAFTTQYAILLSIRARDFPFGDANMNVFGTLPEINDASVPDIKKLSSNGSIDKSLLSIDDLPTNKIIESLESTMSAFTNYVVTELNAGNHSEAQVRGVWTKLDDIMWNVTRNWYLAHAGRAASKCCCAAIINGSPWPVQITRMALVKGAGHVVVGGHNYLVEQRSILGGGVVVIFMWGSKPAYAGLKGSSSAELHITTTCFSATLSTKGSVITSYTTSNGAVEEVTASNQAAVPVKFIERNASQDGFWAKNVLYIEG
jgi:hypothetical protein